MLCQWLLENCANDHDQHRILQDRVIGHALTLVETLVLALKNRQRIERLENVDEQLIALRINLRLAESAGLLSESQLLHCLKLTDSIGRQLGGWLRHLNLA